MDKEKETPQGSRRVPWYKMNTGNTWPSEFFTPEEWASVVEGAETVDKGTRLRLFQEGLDKFESLGEITDEVEYIGLNQLYYKIKLYYSLMEQTTVAQKALEKIRTKVYKIRGQFVSKTPEPPLPSEGAGADKAETEVRSKDGGQNPQMTSARFLTAEQVARVGSVFEAEEWAEVVEEAVQRDTEARDASLRRLCDEFGMVVDESWKPQMVAGQIISPDTFREGLRLFYKAELYQCLMGDPEETREAFLLVQQGLQKAEIHNQEVRLRQDATSPKVVLRQPTLVPGSGPQSEVGGEAQVVVDRKVGIVLDDLKGLTMDPRFETTSLLSELIQDSVRSNGLLDNEESSLAGILSRFGKKRLGMLRQAYQAVRADEEGRHAAYLGILTQWEDNFEHYTTINSSTRSVSRSSAAASPGRSIYQTPVVKEPLPHLQRSTDRPLGVFNQFATFKPRFTNDYVGGSHQPRPQENFEPRFPGRSFTRQSPLAHFVGIDNSNVTEGPPGEVRTSTIRAGIMGEPTTQPYKAKARPGTLGEGFGTGTGSVPQQQQAARAAASSGAAAMGTTVGQTDQGNVPDNQLTQAQIQMQMMRLMDQVCDKLSNSDQGAGRSLTRLKFPDLKAEKFNGEESKFLPWLLNFQEMISLDKNLSDHYKVVLLKQHLSESVKEQLKFTGNSLGFNQALDILLRKYARPGKVQDEYRRKIQQLKGPSSAHDYAGLEKTILETRKYLNALELLGQSPETVDYLVRDKLMSLLPAQMENRFRDFLFSMHGNWYPTELHSTVIMDAMETFAERHKDTKMARESTNRSGNGSTQGQGQKAGGRGATQSQNPPTSQPNTTMVTTTDQTEKQKWCAMCQVRGDHNTTNCKKYETVEDRRRRFKELNLCWNCAGTHAGGVNNCKSTWRCGAKTGDKVCRAKHHRALHTRAPIGAGGGPPQGGTAQGGTDAGNTENAGQNQQQNGQSGNGRRRVDQHPA